MSCVGYYEGDTPIHRADPRVRIVLAAAFCLLAALLWHPLSTLGAHGLAIALAALGRLPAGRLGRRLLRFNGFMAVLCLLAPLSAMAGGGTLDGGPFSTPAQAFEWALLLTVKANSIVIAIAALMGTVEPFTLGYAFQRLRVPSKLVHLYIFTVRHLDHLYRQHVHLQRAMKVRGFQPRMDAHTYRSYAYLVGVMLIRSLDRSEKVLDAMRCRGYTGAFHSLRQFTPGRADALFASATLLALAAIALTEWMR